MTARGYKPGLLIALLGISREQLRYWRRELDPLPSRPLFSYQMLLGYAVFRVLIIERWLEPRHLKQVNLPDLFRWLDQPHSDEEREETVISIDRQTAILRIQSAEAFQRSAWAGDRCVEAVYLKTVEEQVLSRLKTGQREPAEASHGA